MPIYEFECQKCQAVTEKQMKISDPPPTTCSHCGNPSLKRLISRTHFMLKGSGWFNTLYSKDGASNDKKKDAKEPPTPTEAPKTCPNKDVCSGCDVGTTPAP